MELCKWLSPTLKHKNTRMKLALTAEKQLAIALWTLATPDSEQSAGNLFGVVKSTLGAVEIQVASAISTLLLRRAVTLGNVDDIVEGSLTVVEQ